jgi:hypothetical protein
MIFEIYLISWIKLKMRKILGSILFLFICIVPILGNVTLSEQDYNRIVDRLKKDRQLFEENDARWDSLRKEIPAISYEVIDSKQILQKIEIRVKDDNPLVYKNFIEINSTPTDDKYFPFSLSLVGGIETRSTSDAKIGLRVFSLEPLQRKHIEKLSLNILFGLKSSAISIGYSLPKPWSNTTIHVYYGFNYSEISQIVGIGIGLNF